MDNINLLRKLGMTEYEARAYLSLAKLGPSTVRDIVSESKLPRNKAYEALDRLEISKRVIILPVSPRKYKISNPDVLKDEVNSMNKSINELVRLINKPPIKEFKDLFWVIKGRDAIESRMTTESTNASKEILTCNRLPRTTYKNMKSIKEAINRSVKVKVICKFNNESIPTYKEWIKAGAKLRVFNEKAFGPLIPRISIYDGNRARLTIGAPEVKNKDEYITLWTESLAFSSMLKTHFMNMWKKCEKIQTYL